MRAIRPTSVYLVLILTTIFVTCQSDDPKSKDHESPKITFEEEEQAKNNVKGAFDLTFNLKDNLSVARIEVFVDDIRIADEKLSNPQETYSLTWDSKSVSDGSHKLKVIVTDTAGNPGEQSFDLVVDNFLLNVTVPSDYLPGSQFEGWIFLSDENGHNLGTQQIKNGSILKFPVVDGFTKNSVTVNMFYYVYKTFQDRIYRTVYTFTNVPVADIELGLMNEIGPGLYRNEIDTSVGTITATINDLEKKYAGLSYEGKNVLSSSEDFANEGSTAILTINFKGTPSSILLSALDDDGNGGKYKFLKNVQLGDTLTLSLNDFTPLNKYEISVPGAKSGWEMNFGFTPSGDEYEYHFNRTDTDVLHGCYLEPGEFSSYTNVSIATIANVDHFYTTYGSQPHKTFKVLDASIKDFNFNDSKISFKTTGIADFARIMGFYHSISDTATFDQGWNVVTNFDSNVTCTLPVIPSEIIKRYFPDGYPAYSFSLLDLYKDSRSSGSYANYLKRLFFGQSYPSNTDGDYETVAKEFNITPSAARQATPHNLRDRVLLSSGGNKQLSMWSK